MTFDERAREAARLLHDEVEASTDVDVALERVVGAPHAPQRNLAPMLAAAAAFVLLVATVAVLGANRNDGEIAVDMDPELEQGMPLRLLSPDDGRDSIRLPVTVEPSTGLVHGQTVHVTATGFEPGESVGIVQCTSDAGEPTFAGADACRLNPYISATADETGAISGEYAVARMLTVPYSGTVDCAEAENRCLIGVGAISNYDRSGGFGISFAPGGAPVALPTLELSKADGLADGESVHVTGSGFTPGEVIALTVCSVNPASCWTTGDVTVDDHLGDAASFEAERPLSVLARSDGTVEGDVPLWRFLPGGVPGTYVDCAVSTCVLRVAAELAPAPLALSFTGDEAAPLAPAIALSHQQGLHPGDRIGVAGAGFPAGAEVYLSLCARQPDEQASPAPGVGGRPAELCTGLGNGSTHSVGDDGRFEATTRLPELRDYTVCETETTMRADEVGSSEEVCEDIPLDAGWIFEIIAEISEVYDGTGSVGGIAFPPPTFGSAPTRIGFAP